jgi:hypothetical protein
VDDRLAAFDGAAKAVGLGHVTVRDLTAPRAEALLLLRPAGEHADGSVFGPQRVHDLRADEAGPSRHQDH